MKEFYNVQGGDAKDGHLWHTFMFDKCYTPYTDYKGCILDQRQAHMEALRAKYGEEKWKNSEEMVKTKLTEMVGEKNAQEMWDYTMGQNARFKAFRKAVDEERGVVRAGMTIPDFEIAPQLPVAKDETSTNKKPTEQVANATPGWNVKGWWSEPESRFKKPGEST
jgi:sortase (surface protein transpeptidase)